MQFLILALKYLPLVLQAVIAIESVIQQAGQGKTKKMLVLDAVKAVADSAGGADAKELQVIGTLIDSVVATLNAFGWAK